MPLRTLMLRTLGWLFLLLPAAAHSQAPLPELPAPTIAFEPAAVVVQGLFPGAEVVWFSIAREPQGYFTRVVRREEITAADATGTARFELESEERMPSGSVWVAADLGTGAHAVATPEGFPRREVPFPIHGLRGGLPGQAKRLLAERGFMQIFYLRPGVGAWQVRAGDGGERDEDGAQNGSIAAVLDFAEPIGTSPTPPLDFAPNDLIVVIDPQSLEFFATQLAAVSQGN